MQRHSTRLVSLAPLAALAAVALAACTTSATLSGFPPATSPDGVHTTLRVGSRRIQGELLEASDSGFVVLHRPEIFFVPMAIIREARFRGLGRVAVRAIRPEEMQTLRHVSRFPAGIPPGVLPQLLAHTGQRQVIVITP